MIAENIPYSCFVSNSFLRTPEPEEFSFGGPNSGLFFVMPELGKSVAPLSPAPARAFPGEGLEGSPFLKTWQKPIFILCLLFWVGSLVIASLRMVDSSISNPLEGGFLFLAAVSTLMALGRRLPLQNVLATAMIITAISAAVIALTSVSGVPWGPIRYSGVLGAPLFGVLPWPLPLLWIFLIVNGRGIARLIMRPWRKTNYYGFWVMGVTCLLVVMFDLGLEPLAVSVKHYWIWQTPESVPAWYTAPWVNFLGWFVTALAILTFTMPWLINKQPVKQPIDYYPLVLWLMLNIWIGLGNALHQAWPAVVESVIGNAVVATYAIRGARW